MDSIGSGRLPSFHSLGGGKLKNWAGAGSRFRLLRRDCGLSEYVQCRVLQPFLCVPLSVFQGLLYLRFGAATRYAELNNLLLVRAWVVPQHVLDDFRDGSARLGRNETQASAKLRREALGQCQSSLETGVRAPPRARLTPEFQ